MLGLELPVGLELGGLHGGGEGGGGGRGAVPVSGGRGEVGGEGGRKGGRGSHLVQHEPAIQTSTNISEI